MSRRRTKGAWPNLALGALLTACACTSVSAQAATPHGAERPAARLAPPAHSTGVIGPLAAIPHTTDIVAIRNYGDGLGNFHATAGRYHRGHWTKLTSDFGGRYSTIDSAVAASKSAVWVAGGRQEKLPSIQDRPAIYRLKGSKLVREKLPALEVGAVSVTSMSAISPSNVWAVGPNVIKKGTIQRLALHYNGHKWTGIPTPVGFASICAISAKSIWAVGVDLSGNRAIYYWNGHTWSVRGEFPSDALPSQVVGSSSKRAYVISSTGVFTWSGTKWTHSVKINSSVFLYALAMHGTSAWAVGYKRAASGTIHGYVLHTTGNGWKALKVAGSSSLFTSVSAVGSGAVVGGTYADANSHKFTVVAKLTSTGGKVVASKF